MLALEININLLDVRIAKSYDDMLALAKKLDVCVGAEMNGIRVYVYPDENRDIIKKRAIACDWPVPDWGEEKT